jgi:HEAT repeat protein
MKTIKTWASVLSIAMSLILLTGFGSKSTDTTPGGNATKSVMHYIDVLKKGTAQQKAAAAYWLGQQHSSATPAIDPLTELLGDKTAVNPTSYRDAAGKERPTLGAEAAAALVQIGRPSIAPLIRILKTSPSAEARKNAAWALGALHDSVAMDRSVV